MPQVKAELRDAEGSTVYSWSIAPPVRDLAPRATARFDSAERDVPLERPGAQPELWPAFLILRTYQNRPN